MNRLLATILSGNSEALIGEAVRSVREWVDGIVVIDTGITDGTGEVAEGLLGERLVVEAFPWRGDFAAARNFALEAAARHGATWALTLDTDERRGGCGSRMRTTAKRRTMHVSRPSSLRNWHVPNPSHTGD